MSVAPELPGGAVPMNTYDDLVFGDYGLPYTIAAPQDPAIPAPQAPVTPAPAIPATQAPATSAPAVPLISAANAPQFDWSTGKVPWDTPIVPQNDLVTPLKPDGYVAPQVHFSWFDENSVAGINLLTSPKTEYVAGGLAFEQYTVPVPKLKDGLYDFAFEKTASGEYVLRNPTVINSETGVTTKAFSGEVKGGVMKVILDPATKAMIGNNVPSTGVAGPTSITIRGQQDANGQFMKAQKLQSAADTDVILIHGAKGSGKPYPAVYAYNEKTGEHLITPVGDKAGSIVNVDGKPTYVEGGKRPQGSGIYDPVHGTFIKEVDEGLSWDKKDWIAIAPALASIAALAGSWFMADKNLRQQRTLSREAAEHEMEVLGYKYAAAGQGNGDGDDGGSLHAGVV